MVSTRNSRNHLTSATTERRVSTKAFLVGWNTLQFSSIELDLNQSKLNQIKKIKAINIFGGLENPAVRTPCSAHTPIVGFLSVLWGITS